MNRNDRFWGGEEGSVSEYEQLQEEIDENQEKAQEIDSKPAPLAYANEEELEEISSQSAFNLDEEESNIVYNARLRLEMARLYEMLINHNLFEGVDASEHAIETVQDEIKTYIVERLEILLGIREERLKQNSLESDFDQDEANFLRQLAKKGMAMSGKPVTQTRPSTLNPVSRSSSASKLKPLVSKHKVASKSAYKTKQAQPLKEKTTSTKLNSADTALSKAKAKEIVKKKTHQEDSVQTRIKSGGAPRNLTKEEIEALAVEDLKKTKGKKPFNKMNAKEKAAEIARVNKRHTRKPMPEGRKPPMSFEQQQAMYMHQQQSRMDNSPDKMSAFNNILASKIAANKINEGE